MQANLARGALALGGDLEGPSMIIPSWPPT
jgi:hypothetical protein